MMTATLTGPFAASKFLSLLLDPNLEGDEQIKVEGVKSHPSTQFVILQRFHELDQFVMTCNN